MPGQWRSNHVTGDKAFDTAFDMTSDIIAYAS